MSKVFIPEGYRPPLSVYEMQRAIEFIKSNFQVNLGSALNLRRVSAPLFVDEGSGLNDNLNGVERPVGFDIPAMSDKSVFDIYITFDWFICCASIINSFNAFGVQSIKTA